MKKIKYALDEHTHIGLGAILFVILVMFFGIVFYLEAVEGDWECVEYEEVQCPNLYTINCSSEYNCSVNVTPVDCENQGQCIKWQKVRYSE